MQSQSREFVIRRSGTPIKLLRLNPARVKAYMRRLRSRFPDQNWSVSDRFLLNGTD